MPDANKKSITVKPWPMSRAALVSVVIHGLVLTSPLLLRLNFHRQEAHTLQVELSGVMDNTQSAEKIKGQEAPKPAPAVQRTSQKSEKSPDKPVVDSPVRVEEKKETPRPEPSPQAPSPPVPIGNADELRRQAMLNPQDASLQVLRQYLMRITKKMQGKLVYPEASKRLALAGNPVVRFTITEAGEIKPGTLAMARSTGYPALDESALQAARDSVPFERPSRDIEVAIIMDMGTK